MSQQRRGLGKGLASLIPTAPPVQEEPAETPADDVATGQSNGVRTWSEPGSVRPHTDEPRAAEPRTAEPRTAGARAAGSRGGEEARSAARVRAEEDDGVELEPVPGAYFAEVPTTAISRNPRQPRQTFDEDALEELAASIGIVGLLQPVVVRSAGADSYELIMGERRWRASQRAGLERIPAIVRETGDDDLLRDALMENLHRQQLNPLEEAAAYQQLLDDFGATHEVLAVRIGRSRPHITNTLRLLNLPPAVQRRVAAGVLSAGHARALLALESPQAQEALAARIVAEGLSVRSVEEIIAIGEGGAQKQAPRRKTTPRSAPPALREIADRLSDLYETKVRVEQGRNKGKIVVEFATPDDLDRIISAMFPDDNHQP